MWRPCLVQKLNIWSYIQNLIFKPHAQSCLEKQSNKYCARKKALSPSCSIIGFWINRRPENTNPSLLLNEFLSKFDSLQLHSSNGAEIEAFKKYLSLVACIHLWIVYTGESAKTEFNPFTYAKSAVPILMSLED